MRSPKARFEDRHRVHFKRTVYVPGTRKALLSGGFQKYRARYQAAVDRVDSG
jgi:hypothetical protein